LNGDAEFRRAISIGEANKQIIELAKNWCAHLSVEKYGGTGLVEVETGLPIGMRRFKCPYASAAGMAGMDLAHIVLDFYDRNCAACKERVPVRLPNLSQLVAERDRSREMETDAKAREEARKAQEIESRALRRSDLSKAATPAMASVLDVIDRFDRDPSKDNHEILKQTAIAAPVQFEGAVLEALFDLTEAGGYRTDVALEVLGTADRAPERLCTAALRALARREAYRNGARIVARHLSKDHESLIQDALPALFSVATPVHGFGPFDAIEPDTGPLLTAYNLSPDLVLKAAQTLLRGEHKRQRIEACYGITAIVRADNNFGPNVIDALVQSLGLPDDPYGERGSGAGNAARVLAQIMLDHPQLVDRCVHQTMLLVEGDLKGALFDVYERVLRRGRRGEPSLGANTDLAHELAFGRFVEALTQRPSGEQLTDLIWFFRDYAGAFPTLLQRHAETLLGAAALIATELDTPQSPLLITDRPADPLKGLADASREFSLRQLLNAVFSALGVAAAGDPAKTGAMLLTTFDTLGEKHDRLKAGLVGCFGRMAGDPRARSRVLPYLYKAMTSQSTRVRGAAAKAYGAVAEPDASELPSLLHQTFLLLLGDPFVLVHASALEALRKVDLPPEYLPQARSIFFRLISAHLGTDGNREVLSGAVESLLDSYSASEPAPARLSSYLLGVIEPMDAPKASKIVSWRAPQFRSTPGFTRLLATLLTNPGLDDSSIDEVLGELAVAPEPEIANVADLLRSAAKICAQRDLSITDEVIEILTAAGCWEAAAETATDATNMLSDSLWDRPMKLRTSIRQVATRVEAAASACDLEHISACTKEWIQLDREIREDDEAHRKKRDPLFGLPLQNPVE
jgi:hypothetical protein